MLQRRSEAAITQASNTSDIVVLNPPRVGGAISPKVNSNYIIGFFAGVLLPFMAFVLLEFLDTRVQSKEDVERITSIPFIGGVGHKSATENLAVFSRPKSAIAESFRALRSNLNYFIGRNEKAVILVTSSISGEGKTFTSLNLASVYALSGKRTLIVGADMRKPKLFADFDLKNEAGLSNYLAGLADFNSICQRTTYENLDLISGGPVPPNPSELLLSDRMREFIDDARKVYDIVIIDTPPMAIVTDAFVLTPYADHSLFLVRQNYTPKNLMKTVEDYYSTGKLKNISIVLNDISRSGPGYGFGYGYGYAYGYGYSYEYGYLYGRKKNGAGYYEEES
jgi:capsular exopolysaccharide synthesis family protein